MENNTWKKRENLENAGEVLEEFERRMNAEVRRQEKIDIVEKRDFRRGELPEKYTAKLLYGWDDKKKFEDEYLKKLEKNWKRWKEDRQIDENKYLKRIEEREEEEEEKMNKRDWRTGHFSGEEILKEG